MYFMRKSIKDITQIFDRRSAIRVSEEEALSDYLVAKKAYQLKVFVRAPLPITVQVPAAIDAIVADILSGHAATVAEYRSGKTKTFGFLVGQVMKATRGQANAAVASAAIRERLDGAGGGDA